MSLGQYIHVLTGTSEMAYTKNIEVQKHIKEQYGKNIVNYEIAITKCPTNDGLVLEPLKFHVQNNAPVFSAKLKFLIFFLLNAGKTSEHIISLRRIKCLYHIYSL